VSLYPTCLAFDWYPEGHPTAVFKNPPVWDPEWFGVAQVTILPPSKLYLPVLPYRVKAAN